MVAKIWDIIKIRRAGIRWLRKLWDFNYDDQVDQNEYSLANHMDIVMLRNTIIALLEKLDSEGAPLAGDYEETLTPLPLTAMEPADLKVIRSRPAEEN
jgi:hypothetical protein